MRKMVLFLLTVVLGLASVNSASAGFVAGANTNVALLQTGYSNYPNGLVNKFTPPLPGTGTMVSAGAGSFVSSPISDYAIPFPGPGGYYNIYLVSVVAANLSDLTTTFGVTFTDGEQVVGVVGSNGEGNLPGNVWGTHIGLKAQVKAALESFYGTSAGIDTTVGWGLSDAATLASTDTVFGKGSQAIEIQNDLHPDVYNATLTSVYGTVDTPSNYGVNGLNELSLVITAVPEPTSLGLFGIGTLVFGLARSRRKKS